MANDSLPTTDAAANAWMRGWVLGLFAGGLLGLFTFPFCVWALGLVVEFHPR